MAYVTIANRLSSLPLLLAGPIVRRTEPGQVSVWFVLKENRSVVLQIHKTNNVQEEPIMSGTLASGVGIGEHVFVYCVTARGGSLSRGVNYYYDIDFGEGDSLVNFVLNGLDLTYDGSLRPSFTLPPDNLDNVRLIHGSCRKPHGEGYDAMEGVHEMLLTAVEGSTISAKHRPHQLFLTGDQIYADDVADALLYMIDDAAKALFKWDEDYAPFTAEDLKPGKRNSGNKLRNFVGFTGMLPDKPEYSKSHLLKFREYATMYLFAWSDVLWPADPLNDSLWPNAAVVDKKDRKHFKDESEHLKRFRSTLKNVRKALANIPTYMIFDDHEITDDWNLNWRWCKEVYSKQLGRRTIQNGLLAYSLFQAWGNTPDQFAENDKKLLLTAAKAWRGREDSNSNTIKGLLNIPTIQSKASISDFPQSATHFDWHFNYQSGRYAVYVMDSRTSRSYPLMNSWKGYSTSKDKDIAFTELISQSGFDKQFPKTFPEHDVILIVSPSPVIGEPFIEDQQRDKSTWEDRCDLDTEAWSLNESAYEKLFSNLASRFPINHSVTPKMRMGKLAFLSGDVHYGLSARYQIWGDKFMNDQHPDITTDAVIAQLTASSFKNETSGFAGVFALFKNGTHTLHTAGYPLSLAKGAIRKSGLPEPSINFVWMVDPSHQTIGKFKPYRTPDTYDYAPYAKNGLVVKSNKELVDDKVEILTLHPNWRYRIDWILGASTGTHPRRKAKPSRVTIPPSSNKRKLAMQNYLAMADDHRSYTKDWGAGKEIVGTNNLGEIRFNFAGEKKAINQILWWRLNPDKGNAPLQLFPLTTFTIPMNHHGDKNKYTSDVPPIPLDPPTYNGL